MTSLKRRFAMSSVVLAAFALAGTTGRCAEGTSSIDSANQTMKRGGDALAPEPKWSKTVNGLQYRLYLAPHDPAKTKPVDALTFEVRNVTDKPIEIETFNGKVPWLDVRITGYRELRTPPTFAKVRRQPFALQPGKTWTCKLSDGYHVAYGRYGHGDMHEDGWVKFDPAGKTYELSINMLSRTTNGVPLTARLKLPARPKPAVYWPPTGKPAPLSTAWSQTPGFDLQTRIAAHAKTFTPGKSIPMRVELRHKDMKFWGMATWAAGYQGTITVSDAAGKQVGRRIARLHFNTLLREKEIRVVALFDLSHAEYGIAKPGKYSVRFDGVPKKPNLVALPASQVFEFEVRGTGRAEDARVQQVVEAPTEAAKTGNGSGLSARIVLPDVSKPVAGLFPAKLELTNRGRQPVRVATLCQAWRSSSKGAFHVGLKPHRWKSDPPSVNQSAKSVVELSAGESTTLPFEVVDGGGETLHVTAGYAVSEEFAKKLNVWSGFVQPVRVVLKRVKKGKLRILPSNQFPLPSTQVSIEWAFSQPQVFAVVCEAVSGVRALGFYDLLPHGVTGKSQVFKVTEVLAGKTAAGDDAIFDYFVLDRPGAHERTIRKGERVIWIARPWTDGDVGVKGRPHFLKVLSDTPENRRAVAALAKEQAKQPVTPGDETKATLRKKMSQLVEKLESPDPQSRREAIGGLANLGSDAKEAVPALVRRLKEDLGKFLSVSDFVALTDCQYARLSSTAFCLLKGTSNAALSEQDVAKLLEHLPDRETTLAVKGLLASQVLAENERFGTPALAGVLRRSSDPLSRVHAAAGLAAKDSKANAALRREAESLLLASLGNDDDTARIAHNALPTLKLWMIEWLLERLGDSGASTAFWNNATSRLSTCNPKGFEKRLKQLFVDAESHTSVNVRINATNGLRHLGLTKADAQLYEQILKDENPHVRRMLYAGLFQLEEPWAAPLLTAGLEDSLPENVGICADGLAALDHKPAVPKLIATLRRDDLGANAPTHDAYRRVGQATVKLADLEGYDFRLVGRPVGSMYSHAMVIENRDEVYRKECTRLLNWWKTTGSGLKWDQPAAEPAKGDPPQSENR